MFRWRRRRNRQESDIQVNSNQDQVSGLEREEAQIPEEKPKGVILPVSTWYGRHLKNHTLEHNAALTHPNHPINLLKAARDKKVALKGTAGTYDGAHKQTPNGTLFVAVVSFLAKVAGDLALEPNKSDNTYLCKGVNNSTASGNFTLNCEAKSDDAAADNFNAAFYLFLIALIAAAAAFGIVMSLLYRKAKTHRLHVKDSIQTLKREIDQRRGYQGQAQPQSVVPQSSALSQELELPPLDVNPNASHQHPSPR